MRLSKEQISLLAQVFCDIGIVFFAAMFISVSLEKGNVFTSLAGLICAICFWILGVVTLNFKEWNE